MDRPDRIEKRLYSCKTCDYSAQIYGGTYFDSGCQNYMATFESPECKILFESLISQIHFDEVKLEGSHGLADEFECLRCGNKNAKVWSKATGKCPECNGEMSCNITGSIRIKVG